jgi:hypothetical protein
MKHLTLRGVPDSIRQDGWWLDGFELCTLPAARRRRNRGRNGALTLALGLSILTALAISDMGAAPAQEGFSATVPSHSLAQAERQLRNE